MKNYFELFSLPVNFAVDSTDLEKKYLAFQTQFHPDKSSSNDILQSIAINEAYKILADDFLRACYLLSLKGIDIQHDEKAVKVDFATLERVLELQEKISEISDRNEIEDLKSRIASEIKLLISAAMKCFASDDLQLSAQILIKAKYLKKSLEDLKIRKKQLG